MNDEPVMAASAAAKDTNECFIDAARASCETSINNTGVGEWLGQALDRLGKSEAENWRMRDELAFALSTYEHTSAELKLVSKLLDVLNEAQHVQFPKNHVVFEGGLDVFWANTIAGSVCFDSTNKRWVYLLTNKYQKPEGEVNDE
jgi:hypothetical protein